MFSILAIVSLASIGKVLTFLIMLSVLVVLHEYGHFIIARRNGVRVNEFAVGMGPKLFGWTSPRSGTLYSLRALPIGGYCAMEGEDGKTSEAEQQRQFREVGELKGPSDVNFQSKSPWARLAIIVAGPVANFILAFVILLVGAFTFGVATDDAPPVVAQVTANSPAARAGVTTGDQIVAIDGVRVKNAISAVDTFHGSLNKQLQVTFAHGGAERVISLTPALCPAAVGKEMGCIGIVPSPGYVRESIGATLSDVMYSYGNIANLTVSSVGLLVTRFTQYASQVSGIVGMGQVATTVQDLGWGPYFNLAATISFALGLFNLLPFPALDGGRGVFIIAELLRGKPVDPEKEAMVHLAGFAALIALMVLVAFHDIARIASGQGIF